MGCWGRITYRNGSYNIKIHAEFSPKTYGVFQARQYVVSPDFFAKTWI